MSIARVILSAAVAILIGVAALTLARAGDRRLPVDRWARPAVRRELAEVEVVPAVAAPRVAATAPTTR